MTYVFVKNLLTRRAVATKPHNSAFNKPAKTVATNGVVNPHLAVDRDRTAHDNLARQVVLDEPQP